MIAMARENQIAAIVQREYSANAKYPNLPFWRMARFDFSFLPN